MKHFFFLFLISLLSLTNGWAQTSQSSDFEYTIKSAGHIEITKYIGTDSIIRVPSSIEGHVVKIIKKLVSTNSTVTEVYIPKSVEKYTGYAVQSETIVKSITFGRGDFEATQSNHPVTLENSLSSFDNIIVFGEYNNDGATIAGTTSNKIIKLKPITVSLNNGTDVTIQLFINSASKLAKVFEKSRYEYLLSALDFQGYNLSDITKIDLSPIANNGVTFKFTNYNPAAFLSSEAIVLLGSETYTNNSWNIPDKTDFFAPRFDANATITYSRTNTQGWNSVCLPFAIRESDFPTNTKIYQMTSGTEDKIFLTRLGENESLSAGTPCFILCDETTTAWNLTINGIIPSRITPVAVNPERCEWTLNGSFETINLGTGYYKLNSAGNAFVQTTSSSNVYPFRCYLAHKNDGSNAPARLEVSLDDEAEITLVPDDAEPQTVKLYDLMGRPRQGNASGFFIRSQR